LSSFTHRLLYAFFFSQTATTELYTLSLHDALPIYWIRATPGTTSAKVSSVSCECRCLPPKQCSPNYSTLPAQIEGPWRQLGNSRSEEHTSELQSRGHLVCRLLLEKKRIKGEGNDEP